MAIGQNQDAGIVSEDLIQPGDENYGVLDPKSKTVTGIELNQTLVPHKGVQIKNVDHTSYTKYIDRPFSYISDDPDDLRAYNQSFGEKAAYALPKLVTRVGTNVLGSTVGLVYGGGAFLGGLFDGPEGANATKSFFDNSFQRSLDGVNDWMDGAMPHYYAKEENDYNFWQSMGTSNFWFNDFSQGASFVVGAVLSEYLTAGFASSAVAAKAGNLFHKIAKGTKATKGKKYLSSGTSDDVGKSAAESLMKKKQVGNMATTLRQLGTGAMYESGVEARHHYDETLNHLTGSFQEEYGRDPSIEEQAHLVDIATKSSNAVFGANVALVGYGNYMMFPKIFGKGFNGTKNSLKGKIGATFKDKVGAYKALYKDVSKGRAIGNSAWRVLKTPLYEGFVEEGGQKLADLSGQKAADYYYRSKQDPTYLGMVSQLLNHTDDSFGEAYGSNQGQKEIGIGFILAALGLPGRGVKTDTNNKELKDANGKTKTGWKPLGGVLGTIQDMNYEKKMIDSHVEKLNQDSNAINALNNAKDAMVRAGVIQDDMDFGQLINSPFVYKNAEHDNIFNFINTRIKSGHEQHIYDQIDHIRHMSTEEFREAFNWEGINDLNDDQIKDKQTEVADMMLERTQEIKSTQEQVNRSFLNYSSDIQDAVVHALSTAKDSDAREESIYNRIKEIIGVEPEGEMEVDSRSIRDEREDIGLTARAKQLFARFTPGEQKRILALPESKSLLRRVGMASFTDATHLEQLALEIFGEQKRITDEIAALEEDPIEPKQALFQDGKNIGGTEAQQKKWARLENLRSEYDKIKEKTDMLTDAINKGLDPDISPAEQKLIDEFKAKNPSKFSEQKDELTQLFKDGRKLRARRHRMLNMVNELMDYRDHVKQPGKWYDPRAVFTKATPGIKVPKPKMLAPQQVSDRAAENSEDIQDLNLRRLYTKYQGKIVEFEYTRMDKKTKIGLLQLAKENGIEDAIVKEAADIRQKNPETDEVTALSIALKAAGIRLQDGPKTGTYRFYIKPGKVKDGNANQLIAFPSRENVDLIIERRELAKLVDNKVAKDRILEIDKLLEGQGMITEFTEKNLSFLNSATNLREVTEATQVQEVISSATEASKVEIQNELNEVQLKLDAFTADVEKLAMEVMELEELRVKSPPNKMKALASDIFNLTQDHAAAMEGLHNLEVTKVQLVAKLESLNTLVNKIREAEEAVESLTGLNGRERMDALNYAVQTKIQEYIKENWLDNKQIIEDHVNKGFFQGVELLSEAFSTEEDAERLKILAEQLINFVTTPTAELPAELVYLLDEGIADLKYKYEQAQPLLNKLRDQLHFNKVGDEYDYRFKTDEEKLRRVQFESILVEVQELKMKYESAAQELRNKLRLELSPLFEEINKQHNIIDKISSVTNLFVDNFVGLTEEIKRLTTPTSTAISDEDLNTREGEMTEEEMERDIELTGKTYYNSPAIVQAKLAKTAGNHSLAKDKYEELSAKSKLTKAEQEQLEAYKSQLVFFEWTARSNKDNSEISYNNFNLIPLTRKSIIEFDAQQPNAEDKIAGQVGFYNHSTAKPDSPRYSKAVDSEGNISKFSQNNTRDELKEDIVLLVVDDQGRPVKHNGRVVYSSLMGTEAYNTIVDDNGIAHKVYRYGQADLIKVNGTVPGFTKNGKMHFTGEMTQEAKAILEQHKDFRQRIINEQPFIYLSISGKSHGMQLYGEEGPDHKAMARDTIVQREQDVKNIRLSVSTNTETNKVSINARQYTVKPGFLYAEKDGNLIRFKINTLPSNIQNNVYNLLRLFAKQVTDDIENPQLFAGTEQSIIKQISDLIYFGKHSKGRANTKFSIYTEGDTLHFGGSSMTFKQLGNADTHPEAHAAFKEFLKTLHVQVNSRNLTNDKLTLGPIGDQAARIANGKSINAWNLSLSSANKKIKKARKTLKQKKGQTNAAYTKALYSKAKLTDAEITALKSKKPEPSYNAYIYMEVESDLSVNPVKWDNYTHFLMGSKGKTGTMRTVEEIPVTVNMISDVYSPNKDNESFTQPQFNNVYLTFNSNAKTTPFSEMSEPNATPRNRRADVNELDLMGEQEAPTIINKPVEGKAPSGVVESQEFVFTNPDNGIQVRFRALNIDHENKFIDHQVTKLTTKAGKDLDVAEWNNQLVSQFGLLFYSVDSAKYITRLAIKEENLEKEENKKKEGSVTDLKTLIESADEEDRPTTEEDIEGASMATTTLVALQEDYQLMNLYEEMEKFKTMVPVDISGNPIFPVTIVQGLIQGRDFGYFTRTGEILLSDEAQRGTIFHEAFHGITYKLLSPVERAILYNEVRTIKGKATTYEGNVKSLNTFTDIEADEWLAEEFRQYALTDGNYTVGSKVKKSLIQKLFDFLFKFFNNLKGIKSLFSRIHSGYYNHAIEEHVTYDISEGLQGREGASMSKHRLNSGALRDLNSGMTVSLFNIIHKTGETGIEDLFELAANPKALALTLAAAYGVPGDHGKRESVHSSMINQNSIAWNAVNGLQKLARQNYAETQDPKYAEEIKLLQQQKSALDSITTVLNEEWGTLVQRNMDYLKEFKLNVKAETLADVLEDQLESNELSRDTLGIRPSNEINLTNTVKPSIRLLLGTLPVSYTNNVGDVLLKTNKSGTFELSKFGDVVSTLYKHLSNKPTIDDMYKALTDLAEEDKTYRVLLTRLGIRSGLEFVKNDNFTVNQLSMLMSFIKTFNNTNESYVTLLAKKAKAIQNPGRYFTDSNTEKIENITKNRWNYVFKNNIRNTKLGKTLNDGRKVLNINSKFKIGNRKASFKTFAKSNLDITSMLPLLKVLGIEFSNENKILEMYDQGKLQDFNETVQWILGDVIKNEGDVSSIFGGDVEGNLKTLIGFEVDTSTLAVTLAHMTPTNKQVFGITRKSYISMLADKLNKDEIEIERLMNSSPFMYGSLFNAEQIIKIRTIEGGKDIHKGRGFDISRTTQGNIAAAHVISILEGYTPLIRTGNKKTERSIQIGENRYRTDIEMTDYLTDLLKAEILTANEIKNNPKIQQIPELRKNGVKLQFFNDSLSFPTIVTGATAYINTEKLLQDDKKFNEFLSNELVQKEIKGFLVQRRKQGLDLLKEYGFITKGKNGNYNNIGIDDAHIQDAFNTLKESDKTNATTVNGKINVVVMENVAKKLSDTQLIGIIEQSRLFLGHPALYADIFKRTSGMVGTKVYPLVNQDILEAMNNKLVSGSVSTTGERSQHVHRDSVRMVTRAEYTKSSEYISMYVNRLEEMGRDDLIPAVIDKFGEMDIFDGGGFVSFDFYRSVLYMTDNWSDKHEAAYQKIITGQNIAPNEIAIFPPLKPQVFTDMQVGGMNLKMFNKFALYPIHPNLSKLVNFKGVPTIMDRIYDDMIANNLDYMVFESSTKIGAKQNSQNEFEPMFDQDGSYIPLSNDVNYMQEFPLENFGIQLDPTKDKSDVRIGTQSATMLFMNVFQDGLINKEDYTDSFKALDNTYHSIHTAMIEKDKSKLALKLGFRQTSTGFEATDISKELMKIAILNEMNKRDIPEHVRDSVDALFSNELSYTNLLANKQKVDDLLYSIVTNTVVARKINGNMNVVQADLGFTLEMAAFEQRDLPGYRPLKFYEFEQDGKTVKAMEVYIPHHLKSEYGVDIDINDLSEEAKEMIAFRIPTEGLNSIEFIKVAGFLPAVMGPTIIVPQEMVAKSGMDYDIDKLTIYFPHIIRNNENKVVLSPTVKNPAELYQRDEYSFKAAVVKLFGSNAEGLDAYLKTFNAAKPENKAVLANSLLDQGWEILEDVYKQPSDVVQNMLLSSMKALLKNEASFPQLISPVGAFQLKDTAYDIYTAQLDAKITGVQREPGNLFDKFSIASLVRTTYQMHQTLGGTGVVATSMTDLAKSQRAGFGFNLEGTSVDQLQLIDSVPTQYKVNFEGLENQPISLGRVFDTAGNYINSSMQQYVTAYVDGEKDPFAMYVNAGQSGAGVHMLLIRAGVPLDTVLKFMSQPVLQEYFTLKNLQSISNETSNYKQDLSDSAIQKKIKQLVGNNLGTALFNEDILDKQDIVNGEQERSETSMLTTNISEMSKGQKALQAQIFNDYLRYKKYAELVRKAQVLAAFDTSSLQNGYNLIYLTALESHVKDTGAFVNLDAKTGPSSAMQALGIEQEQYSFLNSLKDIYNQSPQLFKQTDLKESIVYTVAEQDTNPIKQQMVLIAKEMINSGKSEDEVLYTLKSFDNYITSWVWQTRLERNQSQLNKRIKELFQGPNSLPNRVAKAQIKYGDNILVQDLLPILQEFEDKGNLDYSIDKLQLVTRKYGSNEIDDLADAWFELYHMGGEAQILAEDIIAFSLLKSGTDFHPSSFFHALPGTVILERTMPMIEALHGSIHDVIKGSEYLNKERTSELYQDFLDNSWDNPRIIYTRFDNSNIYKSETFYTTEFKNDRITILSFREEGKQKGIATAKDKYFSAHYKAVNFNEETGEMLYKRQVKKGILGHLKEVDTLDSVVESNNYPFGKQQVKVNQRFINKILGNKQELLNFSFNVNNPSMIQEGIITTPAGVDISLERKLVTNLSNLYSTDNYRIFEASDRANLQLKLAQQSGYNTWAEFAKDPYNKAFMKDNALRQFFTAEIVKNVAVQSTVEENKSTEAPVTQSLTGLKESYNENQCE